MADKAARKTAGAVSGRSPKRAKPTPSASSKHRTGKSASQSGGVKAAGKTAGRIPPRTKKAAAPDTARLSANAQPPSRKQLSARTVKLKTILLERRSKLMKDIQQQRGQALTEEQQRQFESAMDTGDQALLDLERELDISLQEKKNRERQMIDDSLASLEEGTYGICSECETPIDEKRLAVMPFTRLCIACQETSELLEKIERGEQRS